MGLPTPIEAGHDDLRAVAVAYRNARQAGRRHGAAVDEAVCFFRERYPSVGLEEAVGRTTEILAHVARQHPSWLWESARETSD